MASVVVGTCPKRVLCAAAVGDALVLFANPGLVEGGGVPPDRECTVRTQDPQYLRDGVGDVRPVPGLRVGDEVVSGACEGEGVAVTSDDPHIRECVVELGGHGVARLDADHLGPAFPQQGGGDSGASADIGDAGARQWTVGEQFDEIEECGWI